MVKTPSELFEQFFGDDIKFYTGLVEGSTIKTLDEQLDSFGYSLKYTNNLQYLRLGCIASKIKPGIVPIFQYFNCFPINVWISLFSMIIFFSTFVKIFKSNRNEFSENFWNYTSVLLSKSYPNIKSINNLWEKIIIGFWVISYTLLSIIFCNYLLDFMVKSTPLVIIDSWNDLFISESKIFADSSQMMAKFANNENTEMAKNFRHRLEFIDVDDLLNVTFQRQLIAKFNSGFNHFILN